MKKWTEADITQLTSLVNERKTVNQIARIMGRTCSCISTTKTRYGIRKPMMLSYKKPLTCGGSDQIQDGGLDT